MRGKIISWSAVSWSPPYAVDGDVGIEIRGEEGIMTLGDRGFTIYDNDRKVVEEFKAPSDGNDHLKNFASAVREGATPNAGVVDGHRSALLCHLGNISYRTGESLEIDSTTGRIKNNDTAQKYWAREYRDGWFPQGVDSRRQDSTRSHGEKSLGDRTFRAADSPRASPSRIDDRLSECP